MSHILDLVCFHMSDKVLCRWHDVLAVFDEYSLISRMYKDLECQHHLVQERDDQRSDIPDLTSVGFERWVTLLIQAYLEKEHRRLQKVVLNMSISNSDKNERFSKEISWRLFSQYEDRGIRDHVEYFISKHADIHLSWRSNRKKSQSYRDNLFHTTSVDQQIWNSQNHCRRRVSFVLSTDFRSDSSQHFDGSAHKGVERASSGPGEPEVDLGSQKWRGGARKNLKHSHIYSISNHSLV